MHDVRSLADHFDLSERSVNRRLAAVQTALGPKADAYVTRGKVDKYLVTNNGLSVLGRMLELERDGLTIEEAARRVRAELVEPASNGQGNGEAAAGPGSADSRRESAELAAALRETVELLKAQLAEKDRQIERLQDILQNRLPGQVDPDARGEFDLDYLRRTIQAQRQELEGLRARVEELRLPWWRRLLGARPAERIPEPQ
jgi:hypothetical protein